AGRGDDRAAVGELHLRHCVAVGAGPFQLLDGGGGPVGGERGSDARVGAGEGGQRPYDEVLPGVDRLPHAGNGGGGQQQALGIGGLVVVGRPVGRGLAGAVQL